MSSPASEIPQFAPLTNWGRYLVLAAAFLGWMCAGFEMSMYMAARVAIVEFRTAEQPAASADSSVAPTAAKPAEAPVGKVVSWYMAAFLLGAAAGGWLFGSLGDSLGRVKTMGISILFYSLLTGATYFVHNVEMFLILRFAACMGIGGMWPAGVALASEAWPNASRPLLAGLIGTAANVGLVVASGLGTLHGIGAGDWRWLFAVGALPVFLGLFVLVAVPESPSWLASRQKKKGSPPAAPALVVFRAPYLGLTIVGILLGTVPLLGGWGSINWLIPWADKVGQELKDSSLGSQTQLMRSLGAVFGSLIGGWLADQFGRRSTYFVVNLLSLIISGYIFWTMTPTSQYFHAWVFLLGFVGTILFGWLPLYLPELFPTEVRSTGTGVTFNFGRILTAIGVLASGALMETVGGDYGQIGRITHLTFALGMVIIFFAPDTSKKQLSE